MFRARGGRRALVGLVAIAAGALAAPAAHAERATTLVYFANGEQLTSVPRTLWYGGRGIQGAALRTVRFLSDGPSTKERHRGVYSGFDHVPFSISSMILRRGVATVYVRRGIYAPATRGRFALNPRFRLAQITYTLTEFPGIRSVTVVTSNGAKHVVIKKLTRRTFRMPRGIPPRVPLPPWKGPQPGDTRSAQLALRDLGFMPSNAVNGQADYRTQQSLFAFQAWYGLERTGYVDSATLRKLRQLDASPRFPHPSVGGSGSHAEVYRDRGVLLLVTDGKVVRAVHVSTGADGKTHAGTFSIFRKELYSYSVPFGVWLPWASYFDGGRAFHEYPDVPPYPASHGCIRVSAPEAPFVYGFLDFGTTVYIY